MEPPVESFSSSTYISLALLILSLLLLGLFSFLETSITALRLFKLKELEKSTGKYKKLFNVLENDPSRILITILVGSNLLGVVTAILSSQLLEQWATWLNLPESLGFTLGIVVTTVTILIFELIPKNIAKAHGENLFGSTLWITNILYRILSPFAQLISNFSKVVVNWVGQGQDASSSEAVSTEKEIQFLLDYISQKGLMETQKVAMLKGIFDLNNTIIKEVMIPENDIISIDVNSTKEEVLETFSEYQFTRLPVYEKNFDNIIGMLHQKDFFQLLTKHPDKQIKDIIRPIEFIPESAKVLGILKEFREKQIHIAMVLNEFGGISGLVTLENLIEEIVGDINDEYEAIKQKVTNTKTGEWVVSGSIELEELSEILNIQFDSHALTLAGFLTEQFQHVPKQDESITYKNYIFTINQASPKRIEEVLICSGEEPLVKENISN